MYRILAPLLPLALLGCAGIQAQTSLDPSSPQDSVESGIFSESSYDEEGRRAAPRDAFPVLHDPELSNPADALLELDWEEPVIGLYLDGEARAYPISVMGGIELVNDTCGDIPVAVSW